MRKIHDGCRLMRMNTHKLLARTHKMRIILQIALKGEKIEAKGFNKKLEKAGFRFKEHGGNHSPRYQLCERSCQSSKFLRVVPAHKI